ncbi:hypothetical protein D3C87_1764780 [compost metagenome]
MAGFFLQTERHLKRTHALQAAESTIPEKFHLPDAPLIADEKHWYPVFVQVREVQDQQFVEPKQ